MWCRVSSQRHRGAGKRAEQRKWLRVVEHSLTLEHSGYMGRFAQKEWWVFQERKRRLKLREQQQKLRAEEEGRDPPPPLTQMKQMMQKRRPRLCALSWKPKKCRQLCFVGTLNG